MNSFRKRKTETSHPPFCWNIYGKKTMPNLRRRVRKQGSRKILKKTRTIRRFHSQTSIFRLDTSWSMAMLGPISSMSNIRRRFWLAWWYPDSRWAKFGGIIKGTTKRNNQTVDWKLEVENKFQLLVIVLKSSHFSKKSRIWLKVEHFFTFLITSRERHHHNI